ncbi:MAG: hypothetical protein ACRC6G_10755, partial [Deefgea sp.]
MELLNIECLGKSLRLESSLAGWQQLFWDNTLVAEQAASADRGEGAGALQFELHSSAHSPETPSSIQVRLET